MIYRSAGLLAIIALCTGIEIVLILADLEVLAYNRLRLNAYEYFGFWAGILDEWPINYATQPYVMFVSYAFLHISWWHLLVNMILLWFLGGFVLQRVGPLGFLGLYFAATLGGAILFGMTAPHLRPMVGASGAVYGLAGALLSWIYVDRYANKQGVLPVIQAIMLVVLLSLIHWWSMDGQLAWQTHLGGFIFGWIGALLIDPRPKEARDTS